ncbi:hypothetical protein [Endozoicomonas lisbonensis]|uniref:Right handed beta helix domain-containing protein n=1 Tax=Endozoicomonas lisbonensis TaxID=3120522 RepID=A0ABV2SJD4_9GAMM
MTSAVTSTASPPTAPPVLSCNAIASAYPKKSSQITSALERLEAEGHARRNCVLIDHSDYADAGAIFDQLDDEITILLSSATKNGDIQLLTPVTLKSGQHLIGLAPRGKYVQLKAPRSFSGSHMVEVGDKTFKGGETERKPSVIRGIHFAPEWDGKRKSVDSIIFAQCYNGELIVKDNRFTLDRRAAVFLDCKQSNEGVSVPVSVVLNSDEMEKRSLLRGGPGLLFDNNRVDGLNSKHVDAWLYPNEGVFIKMPEVINLPKKYQPRIKDNQFIGIMKDAIELESGSDASILNNTVKPSSTGVFAWGGILLIGSSSKPLYTVADNVLETKFWGIKIKSNFRLSMAKNQITSNEPFKQDKENSLVIVSEVDDGDSCEACNTWKTNSNSSNVESCKGLHNIDGIIHFEKATCGNVINPDGNSASRLVHAAFWIVITMSTLAMSSI